MFEDVAGTQSGATRERYSTCAECGQLFRSDSFPERAAVEDNQYSELAEICPACDALDRQGETVHVLEDDY